jgi:N-methylhydantoinase A/oxoprolinase/acetone carboxylase beta subunit
MVSSLHIDGSEEAPIVEKEVVEQCHVINQKGIEAVVISGVFSPIDSHFRQEHHVRRIIQQELPGVNVVCSAEVSNIGFLERENAAILNASILKFARKTIKGFRAAMKRLDLHCALYLTQNDGTLIDALSAASLPIRTFSSGPTNSMRGAAYLGLSDFSQIGKKTSTIVVDVGGTTTVCSSLANELFSIKIDRMSAFCFLLDFLGKLPHMWRSQALRSTFQCHM